MVFSVTLGGTRSPVLYRDSGATHSVWAGGKVDGWELPNAGPLFSGAKEVVAFTTAQLHILSKPRTDHSECGDEHPKPPSLACF